MKYVKFISSHLFAFLIGVILTGSIGIVVAENIASSTVDYNKNSQTTVEDALDDLYCKANSCSFSAKEGYNFALVIMNNYTEDGENNLYYHDGAGTYGTYEAGDYSLRYSGSSASVANYVCFASDASICPSDNLYRIIGVIDGQIKLIKASPATSTELGTNGGYSSGNYKWNQSGNNTWSSSPLNITNLNTNYVNYLNNIDSKWLNYISSHSWIVNGGTWGNISTTAGAQNVYANELTSSSSNTTYQATIGLMYVSDYMYAASPIHWNKKMYDATPTNSYASAQATNWLSIETSEWTITRRTDTNYTAFPINLSGDMNPTTEVYTAFSVRPVFYLKSNIKYKSGSGTSEDPYRIS